MIDAQAHQTTLKKQDLQQLMENPYTAPAARRLYKDYKNKELGSTELIQELERLKELIQE